ncbi:MAG: MFS transporter, partial [Acidobacteria bacterium]|nr:MFS transporter [Acidobacteriota bacterium]
MNSVTYKQLLRSNLNFRRLWIGQLISELGTWFSFIAELGTVGMLSGSPLATMALLVSRLLPVLFIAPFAGVLVDRASRKKVLIAMDLARAIIALGFLTAGVGGPLWFIILCSGMMSVSTSFFEAAKNASIANMVTRDEMLTANILMFSTRFLQLTLGAALGGVTAARFGYKAAFIINSFSFIASAVFIWLIPDPVMRRREQPAAEIETGAESMASPSSGPSSGNRFLIEVREGLAYIWATPFVRAVIIVNVTWALGGGMNNLIFDRLSRHQFVTGA